MGRVKKSSLRPQLRRCTHCHKVGHNKSRCPDFVFTENSPSSLAKPLHFFVHHVSEPPPHSNHIVDLKNKFSLWNQIEPEAPTTTEPLYQFYHLKTLSETKPIFKTKNKIPQLNPFTTQPPPRAEQPFKTYQAALPPPNRLPTTAVRRAPPPRPFKTTSVFFLSFGHIFSRRAQHAYTALSAGLTYAWQWLHRLLFTCDLVGRKIIAHFSRSVRRGLAIFSTEHLSLRGRDFTKRLAGVVAVVLLAGILPTQAEDYYQSIRSTQDALTHHSETGFLALKNSIAALSSGDLTAAKSSTLDALQHFETAISTINSEHRIIKNVASALPILGKEIRSRQSLILAGQEITLGNTYFLKGLDEAERLNESTTNKLSLLAEHVSGALPHYRLALTHLGSVEVDILPVALREPYRHFSVLFAAFVHDLEAANKLGNIGSEIFGGNGLRRYLLIFQNPHEIRPTGGFMGSFAILEIKDGTVVNLHVPAGGTYDVQGQLNRFLEPPAPLLLANKRWEFQDANWFPDFKTSAEKILWFYRHSSHESADGVIAINASVLPRLLSIIGPVTDSKRNLTLTADTAIGEIQSIVEEGPEKKERRPKQIIGDLTASLLTELPKRPLNEYLALALSLAESLDQKEIQFYFSDRAAEQTVSSFGWGGGIPPTGANQDYLMVVNTNIQGQKSDAAIEQTISHQAVIDVDGTVINTVTITRTHRGKPGEKFIGVPNIDYLRLYVPEQSQLLSAHGFTWPDEGAFKAPEKWYERDELLAAIEQDVYFEPNSGTRISREFGKTVFGNWIIIRPGETAQAQFSYRLPWRLQESSSADSLPSAWKKIFLPAPAIASYQLMAQRQSGSPSSFESQIILPPGWAIHWNDGLGAEMAANGLSILNRPLVTDTVWSMVMKKSAP